MKSTKIIRIIVIAMATLLISFIAMQFTDEVRWNLSDFVVAGTLLLGAGLLYEFLASKTKNNRRRQVLAIAVFVVVILVWVEMAVGIFSSPIAGS